MSRRTVALAAVLTVAIGFGPSVNGKKAPVDPKLVDVWDEAPAHSSKLQRLLIIGISDDLEMRKHFENKFVSHLRGRGVDGVTSYSLVTDLTRVEDETEIVQAIAAREIDGAISVRLVPLSKHDESSWGDAWREAVERDGDLRELIDASLPIESVKSKRWGVEVALWETTEWNRIWAGRTGGHKRKELQNGAGSFVQNVIRQLKGADLL